MAGGGAYAKARGRQGEQQLADKLGAWWKSEFHRMPASGALRWNGAFFTYGDLIPPEDFPAVIECKVRLQQAFDLLKPAEHGWISETFYKQLWNDIVRAKKETGQSYLPILAYKIGRNAPWFIIMDARVFDKIGKEVFDKFPYMWIHYPSHWPIIMIDLKTFLANVTPEQFKKAFELDLLADVQCEKSEPLADQTS